jgi:hypothetical protein
VVSGAWLELRNARSPGWFPAGLLFVFLGPLGAVLCIIFVSRRSYFCSSPSPHLFFHLVSCLQPGLFLVSFMFPLSLFSSSSIIAWITCLNVCWLADYCKYRLPIN